jgi:hypothetical protein
VIGTRIDFGRGFWRGDRKLSGKRIDVLRMQNIPHNSRCIDRTVGGKCVVSHKSTDLRLKSYQSPQAVYRLGMCFVGQLRTYAGEVRRDHKKKATYHLHWAVEAPDAVRVLEWFVPLSGVTPAHESALQRVIEDASRAGVTVALFRVTD